MERLLGSEAADVAHRDRREVAADRGQGGLRGSLLGCHDGRWPRASIRSKRDPVELVGRSAGLARRARRPRSRHGKPQRRSANARGLWREARFSGNQASFSDPYPRSSNRDPRRSASRGRLPGCQFRCSKNKPEIPMRWQAPPRNGTFRPEQRAFLSGKEAFHRANEASSTAARAARTARKGRRPRPNLTPRRVPAGRRFC